MNGHVNAFARLQRARDPIGTHQYQPLPIRNSVPAQSYSTPRSAGCDTPAVPSPPPPRTELQVGPPSSSPPRPPRRLSLSSAQSTDLEKTAVPLLLLLLVTASLRLSRALVNGQPWHHGSWAQQFGPVRFGCREAASLLRRASRYRGDRGHVRRGFCCRSGRYRPGGAGNGAKSRRAVDVERPREAGGRHVPDLLPPNRITPT